MQYLDFIGDVHGSATKLQNLLKKLGYRIVSGAWKHPTRIAVFVGDIIDRGPEQLAALAIVRGMVDAGNALCVMGNHEHNAIGWTLRDPRNPNEFCRPHRGYNEKQHIEFLSEIGDRPALHREWVRWMGTLPVLLDINGIRVAHACWDERHTPIIEASVRADGTFSDEKLIESWTRGTALFTACEVVMKGPEVQLPHGRTFVDALGKLRSHLRIGWWMDDANYRRSAMPFPGFDMGLLPDEPIPQAILPQVDFGRLHFFGHYWLQGTPAPLRPHVASVDYSGTAAKPLTAYCWQGECELQARHFLQSDV